MTTAYTACASIASRGNKVAFLQDVEMRALRTFKVIFIGYCYSGQLNHCLQKKRRKVLPVHCVGNYNYHYSEEKSSTFVSSM